MESPQKAHPPRNPVPETLAYACVVFAVVGVGLLVAVIGLALLSRTADGYSGVFEFLVGWGFMLSLGFAYLAAPLVAWLLGLNVRGNWQEIVTPDNQWRDQKALRRLARRLLTTALLLGLVSGLPAVATVLAGRTLVHTLPGGLSFLPIVAALAASYVGYVAAKLYAQLPGRRFLRVVALLIVPTAGIVIASHFPIGNYGYHLRDQAAYVRKAPTFDGNSVTLPRTVVVPTLDSPCPPDRNVIWCSSFQLTWNEIRDNVIGAPLDVNGAEKVAERLNAAGQSIADLEPDFVYAVGGWIKEGIIDTIRQDMAARFPKHAPPDFNDHDSGILAYSYLTAQVPFKHPFRQAEEALVFTDSQGTETEVRAFGLWKAHLRPYQAMREQIDILFCRYSKEPSHPLGMDEYALDLCRHSAPYQVVVAVVEPNESLARMYDTIQARAAEFRRRDYYEEDRQFGKADILEVPEMFWEIDHRFEELIGKGVANVGMPIVEALQTIRFRLDRSGALLESESLSVIAAGPREFVFDRPFLVYLRKRGAEHPFFVMWVDNAELLTPR